MQATPRYVTYTALLFILGVGSVALADPLKNTLGQQRDVMQALQSNPTDTALSVRLADLAMETGEYQLAIAQMERLVTAQQADAEVMLKLGILYYMIGAYDNARSYLAPLNNPANDRADIRAQAERYLIRM